MSLKSVFALLLPFVALAGGVIACGGSTASTAPPAAKTNAPAARTPTKSAAGVPQATKTTPRQASPTTAATQAPKDTTTYLGDVVEANGFLLSADKVEDPATPSPLYKAEAGKKLIAVEATIGNLSESTLSANPLSTTLLDAEGFTYQPELGARNNQIATLDLGQGEKVKGWIAFKIPTDAKPASLKFTSSLIGGAVLQVGLLPPPAGHKALTASTKRQPPQLAKLGTAVEASGYSLTATKVEDPTKPGILYKAQKGTRLVAVEIVLANVSGPALSVNPLSVFLVDTEGYVYQAELGGRDGQIATLDINPGEKARGFVAFQVPQNAKLESVKYAPPFAKFVLQTGLAK